jgi:hypothetical protein
VGEPALRDKVSEMLAGEPALLEYRPAVEAGGPRELTRDPGPAVATIEASVEDTVVRLSGRAEGADGNSRDAGGDANRYDYLPRATRTLDGARGAVGKPAGTCSRQPAGRHEALSRPNGVSHGKPAGEH